jgi:hypothetical protein
MSNQNAKGKPKYESPIIVPLGEMAIGSGACSTGSGVVCGPYAATVCSNTGSSPVDYCDAGVCATQQSASYCSEGTTASTTAYCTAGNSGGACNNGGAA